MRKVEDGGRGGDSKNSGHYIALPFNNQMATDCNTTVHANTRIQNPGTDNVITTHISLALISSSIISFPFRRSNQLIGEDTKRHVTEVFNWEK